MRLLCLLRDVGSQAGDHAGISASERMGSDFVSPYVYKLTPLGKFFIFAFPNLVARDSLYV